MKNKLLFTLPFLFLLFLVVLGMTVGAEAVILVIAGVFVLALAALIGLFFVTYFGD